MDKNYQILADHRRDKEESVKFKERRFIQWNENYSLFRDKVNTNRLTQRQPINVPIVRETIQSWISKIDEAPKLKFETRDRSNKDKDSELVMNELYNYYYDKLKLDILDNAEKKIVGLQGRGFKKLGISRGEVFVDLIDPYDLEIDPRVNPLDLETANYVIHTHIFRSLREILANPKFDESAKKELKIFLDSKQGLLKAAEDEQSFQMRKQRLENLGVTNYDEYGAADVMVELNESYKLVWSEEEKRFVRNLRVIATDSVLLYDKPLKEAIGIRKIPIVTWASDPDAVDFWSDGIADNVRTFNKITNMYISQDLENRSYRNFGMYFFNTLNGTFQPRAFDPKPFGMYGVPGNPKEIVQQIEIQPLNDVSNQITWLKNLIQSSVAQTPAERGVKEAGEQTLGQVQLQLKGSQGMNQVVSKNYRRAWKEFGCIFYDLLVSNNTGLVKLFKKGSDNNYYHKEVYTTDYATPNGYEVKVEVEAEKSAADDFDLKKLQYIKNSFIDNPLAIATAKKHELEVVDIFTPEEVEAIMAAENPQQPTNVMQDAPSKVNNPQDSIKSTNANVMNGKPQPA
jgi:hypothetical protein